MSESSGPRRFIEGLLNSPAAEFADEVLLRERVAVWMFHFQDDGETFATVKDVGATGSSSKRCGRTSVLDIGGTVSTGADGTAEFLLSDFWCHEWFSFHGTLTFEYPVLFVATPQTNAPIFLTSLQAVVQPPPTSDSVVNDIKVTVFSWETNGNPRGNVLFDWRCSVPLSWDSIFNRPGPRSRQRSSGSTS